MTEYRKPNTQCAVCGKKVYRRPSELKSKIRGVFCGHACYGVSQQILIPCIICGKMILSGANKKTCSRGCANKNRTGIKYTGKAPKDKVKSYRQLKKRLLVSRGKRCERCEYSIHQILQVHHRDRNRNHNELSNLELLCPNCHAKEHYLKK